MARPNDSEAIRRALSFKLSPGNGIKGWTKQLTMAQLNEFEGYIEAFKGSPERVLTYAASMTHEVKDLEDVILKMFLVYLGF